ncbi:hypothetical protein BX616_002372 [Lobosporangium transversale]|uniref:Uncharacterized protein n=1 Tax=Lobosporangium transversale TaxID=64571 RepID=A0A1Y2G857_9FUNG|nr:hypothetical protein BCR41DRAFT_426154 [Lobosporangium transversale]KAF9901118.1 hypothetical protein BX616_002372 [Lobosporangium transversale]ORZ02063.1 hypothetical protein BCR41DRAFT_426154 [Lobosporangium transversale]|eukprot:XP_021876291.1 hypothetical protein BCR41DRAFT_426154 [Lobosporangium transversale]
MDNTENTSNNATKNQTTSFDSNVFIYATLFIGFLVAVIYFSRVVLVKRKYRRQATKNFDYESCPPMYLNHLQDLQVFGARSGILQEHRVGVGAEAGTGVGLGQATATGPIVPSNVLIRGEGYYFITPRTHSITGSATATTILSRNSNINAHSNANVRNVAAAEASPPPAYEALLPCEDLDLPPGTPGTNVHNATNTATATTTVASFSTTSLAPALVRSSSSNSCSSFAVLLAPHPQRPSSSSSSYFSNAFINAPNNEK